MKRLLVTLSVFASAMALSACGSMIDHQTQDITVRTPGAENAKCYLYNQDMKYQAWTDQTIEIMKSPNDLVVNCLAAGNREQTVMVERGINGWTVFNVANGVLPGVTYDHFSRGLYSYPEEITVSFSNVIKPYPAPQYHADDLKHNNVYNQLPRFGPTEPVMQENRVEQEYQLQKVNRYGGSDFGSSGYAGSSSTSSGGGYPLDSIHRQYNPNVSYDPTEEDK